MTHGYATRLPQLKKSIFHSLLFGISVRFRFLKSASFIRFDMHQEPRGGYNDACRGAQPESDPAR